MNLNSLPDLLLARILSFLPLRDLLLSHYVCPLWASLLGSVCVIRRQVTICIGQNATTFINNSRFRMPYEEVLDPNTPVDSEPRPWYDAQNLKDNFDLLHLGWLNSVTCDKLVSLLPNVIELKVYVGKIRTADENGELSLGQKSVLINQIIKMLTRWRSTLVVFNVSIFDIDNKQPRIDQDHWRLFHAINQLDSLRRLTIDLMDYPLLNNAPSITDIEPFQFSVLSHLEQFSFTGYDHYLQQLLPSLIKHGGPESTLQRISLMTIIGEQAWSEKFSPDFANQMGNWMRNVVHFPFLRISISESNLLSMFEKFPRLEHIIISMDSLAEIPQMLNHLESLRHLTYLRMELTNHYLSGDEWDDIDRPAVQIVDPCLPSVRVLVIYEERLTHESLDHFSWPSILPNLEIFNFRSLYMCCKICQNELPSQRDIKSDCTKKFLSPWTRCPRIRRIYSGDDFYSKRWNLSELRQYLGDE